MNMAENILNDDWQTNSNKRKQIKELNDEFRKTFIGGQVLITDGIDSLEPVLKAKVLQKVREFNEFDYENDPYNEHDFGSLEVDNVQVFWKIDYYDLKHEFCSEDPSNPALTNRVLTILLPEEY